MKKYYEVKPISNFNIDIDLPGSKSISNRALILAAFENKWVTIENLLFSDDTIYMIEGLKKLGVQIEVSSNQKIVKVKGISNRDFGKKELYVGNAGTAMRFLCSFIATGHGEVILNGNNRMKERPIKDLVNALRDLNITVEYLENEGFPPIKIISNGVIADKIKIDCSKSSQYLSSLLLSACYFKRPLEIDIAGKIVSKPYVNMTLKMVEEFGGRIEPLRNGFKTIPSTYDLDYFLIEGDMSSASYFLAAALIGNAEITLNNFFKNSLQGDIKFLNILQTLGLEIKNQTNTSITVKGVPSYSGIKVNLNEAPDVAQTLAIVALFANSPTEILDVENMRIKETDRIKALKNEIEKLGGIFEEYQDGFKIIPCKNYNGADIETYDDHRMAMSFSLAGLKIPGIKILNPSCVSKTFPQYFDYFERIYKKK